MAAAVRIVLELVAGGEPIQGRLSTSDGEWRSFTGWMALARAIDDALTARRRQDTEVRDAQ